MIQKIEPTRHLSSTISSPISDISSFTHVHIGVVSRHDPQRLVVVGRPEPRCPVVPARGEIMAVWGEPDVPDRENVSLVAHQAGPRL